MEAREGGEEGNESGRRILERREGKEAERRKKKEKVADE